MCDKRHIDDLAMFGGAARMDEPLYVGRPNLPANAEFLARVSSVLDSGWVTNDGSCVRELESRLADYLDVSHCVAVCNGTMGLQIAAKALQLSGEVVVPSMTFAASAHAMSWIGLAPVFCDVNPDTWCVGVPEIESALTADTSAILGVHLWGTPCPVEAIDELAGRYGLRVLYDAAHAFGCSRGGAMIGGFGDAEVFSLHGTKFFHTMEGGCITTRDADLAARMRLLRNFGFVGYDDVEDVGVNGKMCEVAAAMGLSLFDVLETLAATNCANFEVYQNGLKGIPGVSLRSPGGDVKKNWQHVVLELDKSVHGLSRDLLIKLLWDERVRARRYFHPGCHRMSPYRAARRTQLPVTEAVLERVIQLPTGLAVTNEHIGEVCGLIRFAVENGEEIAARAGAK